jgi:hypothetical protein
VFIPKFIIFVPVNGINNCLMVAFDSKKNPLKIEIPLILGRAPGSNSPRETH